MLIGRQGLGLQYVANSTLRLRVLICVHGAELDGNAVRLRT